MSKGKCITGCKFKTLSEAGSRISIAFGLLALSGTTLAFTPQPDVDLAKNTTPREIILIDGSVKDHQVLTADLKAGQQVVYIGVDEDPLKKLLNLKHGYQNVSALHIVSHGEAGGIRLGNRLLTNQTLNQYSTDLRKLAGMFTPDGDIMLYGCDVAAGWQGRQFVSRLGELTGTDVAASNDKTGASALTGDWELEFAYGSVDSGVFYPGRLMKEQYAYVLPTFDFDNPASSGGGTQTVTQTVSGVTLTATIDSGFDNWIVTPALNGSFGWTGNVLAHTGFTATNSQTFTFSSAVDITSIRLGDTGTPQNLLFIPSSGTTYSKDLVDGTTSASEVFSPTDWTGITTFEIKLDGVGGFNDVIIDDIVFNTTPTVSGAPSDVTVIEDVESNINLSAITFADADGDSLTVTLTVSGGTFSTPVDGSGVGSGVTETLVSATQITLAGAAADINTYLDTATNIKYTGASNVNGNDAATITISATDGTAPLASNPVVNVDIAAVGDTPSVTNATTNEDTQTTSGLVITRSVNDGAEVTHYKITSITGGTLYQNNGSTAIANNAFITVAEGAVGLKFTPTANSSSNGSFDVQAGTDGVGGGLSAGSATATITVTTIADTPSITNASTNEDVQTTSGLVVSRNANDGAEVTHFRVSGITGGTLYQNNGTTAIANNEYITFAQANAGLKFTPTANSFSNGSFSVQGATSAGGAGLSAGSATATITVTAIADTPSITNASTDEDVQTTSGLVVSRNANDGAEVTHFRVSGITGGTLYQNNGTTAIANNEYITFAQANAGLKFTPTANSFSNGSFSVQGATSAGDAGLSAGSATATITVTAIADTPSITNASTDEDTQTTSGLVITRNVNDGAEVTHYKITSISGGTLYQNNGTTVISNNEFITVAEGAAGLKFTPTANSSSNGSFDVQAGTDGVGGGLSAGSDTATITVTAIADTPSITNASTDEDVQTTSGLVVSRNANDSTEVTHFRVSGITGGTLYQNDGTTAIANNEYITFAQANAGLKFTPTANSFSNGSFSVQGATSAGGAGLSAGSATATITVTAIADTPSITNASTDEDVQTTSGLVVSRNANDSTEVTHFRVSGITGGTLYQNDGTTAIANNEYITFAQANAGLKFTPTANSFSNGSFNGSFSVQGATSAGGAGLSAGSATATITVSPVGDIPNITGASTNKNVQTTSGLVITKNENDGDEVTHYKITSINGGTLYQNDGITVILNDAFITVAEGAAGLKFTPATNSTVHGTFNVKAGTDGLGGGLSAGSATATITVAGVNNPPTGNVVITGLSNPPLVGQTLTADTAGISDADGLGTFSYQWNRGGSSISGATSITYSLVSADVGNAITVTVSYSDGDSTLESITSAATAAVDGDFDGDGIGDAIDDDDDNDGMPDDWELTYGLDPKDASDATGDIDGDGVSNLDEFIASSDPTADDYAPVVTPPVDITIDATGLFTAVDVGIATATDDLDGVLIPTSDAPSHFTPGVNTVTWSATDAAGNTGTATQIININPLVNFSKDQVTSEGSTVNFSVILNGDAVTYPVSIPYTVSGTAATDLSDHDLVDGTATINSGTKVVVSFTAVDDGTGEGLENIVVTMGVPTNAAKGPNAIHTIDLVEGNVAPTVSLSANQGAGGTLTVTQVDGLVTVASNVLDPNNGDTHTYDWSMTDNALIDTDGVDSSFSFDPSGVSAGVYTLRLSVSDGNATDEAEISINVVSAAPVLTTADSDDDGIDDQTEGYGDSDGDGVAEYLDAISSINVLQEQAGESARYLIETEPGLTLSLSRIAFLAGNGQAQVSPTDITNAGSTNDDTTRYEFAGGLFDFTVSDLPVAGQSASIVLAQLAAIPANAVYRKLVPGGWQDFVVDADNAIASAPGVQGYCPPPGDAAYQTGLTEGHWCVQLTIKDGGPNDGDGAVNNSLDDPGGVATILATDVNVKVSSGGGSQDPLWLALLALLVLPHFLVVRKGEKH